MKTNCPTCSQALQTNLSSSHPAVCTHCGSQSEIPSNNLFAKKGQFGVIRNMVLASLGLFLFTYHVSNWGSQSLNIVLLKTAQIFHIGSADQYSQLHKICLNMKRYDCAEGALKSHYKVSGEEEQLKDLALLQMRREKNEEAVQTYKKYFEVSSSTLDKQSAFNYAKLLYGMGEYDSALNYYDKIIEQDLEVFSVSAVEGKIKLLVQLNRHQEAKQIVNKYKSIAKDDSYIVQVISNLEKHILNNS